MNREKMILIFTWQALPRSSSAVKSIQKWIAMREKMDGILFICQTTHRLKKIGTEKSLLFVNIELKKWRENQPRKLFFKKRPTTTLCLYCNDFMEVLTNKIKVKRKCTKIWLKGDDREKSNSKLIYNQKIWGYTVF